MEGSLTDANRQRCAEAAKPLLQAIETLTNFAASPEFASIPAAISEKVCNMLILCMISLNRVQTCNQILALCENVNFI